MVVTVGVWHIIWLCCVFFVAGLLGSSAEEARQLSSSAIVIRDSFLVPNHSAVKMTWTKVLIMSCRFLLFSLFLVHLSICKFVCRCATWICHKIDLVTSFIWQIYSPRFLRQTCDCEFCGNTDCNVVYLLDGKAVQEWSICRNKLWVFH